MVIIKKSTNSKCWRGCGKKGILPHCWWECKLVQLLRRTLWRSLKKLKIELPQDPAIPVLSIYLEKSIVWKKKSMYPSVQCSSIYNSQDVGRTCLGKHEWIKQLWFKYRNEYYSATKRKETGSLVDESSVRHKEWSKWEREKQIYFNIYLESRTAVQMNVLAGQELWHRTHL